MTKKIQTSQPKAPARRAAAKGMSGHTVKVGLHQGRTTILVDGQPLPGAAFLGPVPYEWEKAITTSFEEVVMDGIRIVLVDAGVCTWDGPGKWNFSRYLGKLERVLHLEPEAWLVVRLYVNTPGWWGASHPEECVHYADRPKPELAASMGSQRWIADSSEFLSELVRAVEGWPVSKRILGYSLMCGHGGEWIHWGAGEGRVGDYSQPALTYYRNWLKRKYGNEAWIDKAQIPTEDELGRTLPAMLRDPQLDARAIDYDAAFSDMIADNLLALCRTVKQETAGKRLAGVFYGYLLWQSGLVNPVATNGHLALRRVLDSKEVDFLTSFPSYDVREHGSAGPILLPVESVQQAGKLVFNECDHRTHMCKSGYNTRFHAVRDQRDPADGPQLFSGMFNIVPGMESAQISIDVLRRDFAHHLIRGAAWWWFDMCGGWFSGPEISAEFKKQSEIARQALDWDMSSCSEVAGIVSGESCAYHSMRRMFDCDPQASLVELHADMSTREMYKGGAPIDWLMPEDLHRPVMDQYKVLYFHNPTFLSDKQQKALAKLKSNGRTIIFVGYPGLVSDGRLDAEAASRTAGMRLKLVTTSAAARFAPRDYNVPCLQGAVSQTVMGTGAIIAPRLIVDDPEAEPILHWADGTPAAAMKRHADWTAYYFAVPPNNAYVFRAIFKAAGCHIYTPQTNRYVVYANRSLLATHTNHYDQTVVLPRPANVTDLFTGQVVTDGGTRFNTARAWVGWTGATRLYRVEEV
jgi:hypothetical protein